ncbi:phytoene desaturase family protein [Actinocatenispora sera]|uniref:Pyridine nucleotide-disulfide oxidoreductase domain-containing protein 2 n=1 Tax=Actinocatenispora sera TaxID=390989 RepID=A0A810LA92_9ACTN|nr:NAD(P)/FAD-dependent oxidoreductase [Actinocatenispora sera]BCJ32484.1 FAD-dependent oxidoreductase [Actinocatenispora sera]
MTSDVIVVGAGHNGLVAATLLARAGLTVQVLERAEVVGGACRTEAPFGKTPGVRVSSGAYLLGLMPPELIATLDIDLPLVRRDPHYFLPARDGRYLLLGGDRAAARRQFAEFFTEADDRADEALRAELSALANDLAPAWLAEPLPVEQTAERYIRPQLRDTFVDLVRGSAIDYLSRFGFASEQVIAMYAVTDGMPGLTGSPWTPGSGHNMLVHNMCRLPGADGTWMVVRGGMGTVTRTLAAAATAAGATIRTGVTVDEITTAGGAVTGVRARSTGGPDTDAAEYGASAVLVATDPYRLPALLGATCPPELADRIDGYARRSGGQTMKVNLALSDLPRFAALPQPRGQHGTTVHLLPEPAADGSVLTAVRQGFDAAAAGRLDPLPPVEWYLHSTLDPSLGDDAGRHSSALFVQGVPHTPAGSDWATEKDGYVRRLLEFVDGYAPGVGDLVDDVYALAPPDIEAHFGITGGNIFHVDNAISFTDRMPYRTGVAGVYAGAAGCFPAGSVIGCAGHNAAHALLADLH